MSSHVLRQLAEYLAKNEDTYTPGFALNPPLAYTNIIARLQERCLSHRDRSPITIFDTPIGQTVLVDIATIPDQVAATTNTITTVGTALQAFDLRNYANVHGNTIRLGGKWSVHQDAFAALVRKTHHIALDAKLVAEEYALVVGIGFDSQGLAVNELKTYLKYHIARLAALVSTTDQLNSDFVSLKKGVNSFTEWVGEAAAEADPVIQQEIRVVAAEINTIIAEITRLEVKIKNILLAHGSFGQAIGIGGILVASVDSAPVAGTLMLLSVIGDIAPGAGGIIALELADLRQQLATKRSDLANISVEAVTYEAIKVQIIQAGFDTTEMCNKMSVVSNIWSHFATDAKQLKVALDNVELDIQLSEILLPNSLQRISTLYASIGETLGRYASNVDE